jgi:formylglycine-generating enzyme required for sulfatase activity
MARVVFALLLLLLVLAFARAETPTPAARSVRCDGIEVTVGGRERSCMRPSAGKTDWFKDCPLCPEMVVVPEGSFIMGSPKDEPLREPYNKGSEDQLGVTIDKPFAVGRFAIARVEFAVFISASGYDAERDCLVYTSSEWKVDPARSWRSPGFSQTDRDPVVCVNWDDAKAYAAWLSSTTGKVYRLLSESEREYVTRAGTATAYWWGATQISTDRANFHGTTEYRQRTVPVDSFASNAWGLYNVHGNVWDWTEDCWNASNAGNPGNGEARSIGECSLRVLRGGSWGSRPQLIRSANRYWYRHSTRSFSSGFRVARTLE